MERESDGQTQCTVTYILISLLQKVPWSRVSGNRKKHSLDLFNFVLEFESLESAL